MSTIIKQISVFVENKTGRLSYITRCLADSGVNIRALCMADTTDFGIFRLIVSDYETAASALKAKGITASVTDVIAIAIDDTPGAFADAVEALSNADISVEYAYAFLTPEKSSASVILRVSDIEKACKVLTDNGVHVIEQEEIN